MITATQRAKSRLRSNSSPSAKPKISRPLSWPSLTGLTKRLRFLPLLMLAGIFYAGLAWLIMNVEPSRVSSFILPNSFLPFHVLLLLGNFFLVTFLTLSKRWGVFIALGLEWLVFLRLQEVTWDLWAVGSALVIGAGGWWLRHSWKNSQANL